MIPPPSGADEGSTVSTIALNGPDAKRGSTPPIIRHPAFPAIVALWFAALLGLGTLVLPAVLLERIVSLTGITALVPEAAPPLGFTARAAMGGAAGVFGALLGLFLARRVREGHHAAPRRKEPATGPRPLRAHEDLDLAGIANGNAPANRLAGSKRRALAMVDENQPSEFLNTAPLPGEDPWAEPAVDAFPSAAAEFWAEPAPLDLDVFPAGAGPGPLTIETLAGSAAAASDLPMTDEDYAMSDKQEFQPLTPEQHVAMQRQEFHAVEEPGASTIAAPFGEAGLGEDDPLPFTAPSLLRQAEDAPEAAMFEADEEEPALGQLVQRLGSSMEKRRELRARQAVAGPSHHAIVDPETDIEPAVPLPDSFEAARPEEAAQAMAAFFGKPAAIPEPRNVDGGAFPPGLFAEPHLGESPLLQVKKRGLVDLLPDEDADGEDDEYLPSSFTLPLRRETPAAEPDDEEESPFGSLLELGSPFAVKEPGFVRIDEPEDADDGHFDGQATGVVFPGSEPQPPLSDLDGRMFDGPASTVSRPPAPEMEDALRSALSKLQRMSGAA